MKRTVALMALTLLTACDYAVRKDIRAERDDRIYRAAMDDYRAGRMDAAIAGLEKAVRNDPSNASARFQLACLQQDLKKDYLSAFCGYREFLVQQPECDRAKLARERLTVCEKESARALATKYGLNASDGFARELETARAELKTATSRAAAAEKDLAALRERLRLLSADRDRLLAVVKGGEGNEAGTPAGVVAAKDLLEEEDEGEDESRQAIRREKSILDKEDEESTGSSLIPVRRVVDANRKTDKASDEQTSGKKVPDHPKTYVVEDGDTLYGVSKRFYGSIQFWKAIREANKALISSDNRLRAGDTLVLP